MVVLDGFQKEGKHPGAATAAYFLQLRRDASLLYFYFCYRGATITLRTEPSE